MPEGPSILILKDAVQLFKGKKIIAASNNNDKLNTGLLLGKTIKGFKSWGKHFLICFPKFTIRIHLMMFGTYRINEHTNKPARLHLQFSDGELNFYACLVELIEQPLNEVYDWSADVMNPKWNVKKVIAKMKENPQLLACDALMDQHLFSGVGNIIKNEVLFRTRIHPLSLVSKLPTKKLREFVAEPAKYALDFLEWKKAYTLKKHWQAYNQKTCPRDHIALHKVDTGKSHRRSFYCSICQVLYNNEKARSQGIKNIK